MWKFKKWVAPKVSKSSRSVPNPTSVEKCNCITLRSLLILQVPKFIKNFFKPNTRFKYNILSIHPYDTLFNKHRIIWIYSVSKTFGYRNYLISPRDTIIKFLMFEKLEKEIAIGPIIDLLSLQHTIFKKSLEHAQRGDFLTLTLLTSSF